MQLVADWSQAEIDYTAAKQPAAEEAVADWSQAEIDYTKG